MPKQPKQLNHKYLIFAGSRKEAEHCAEAYHFKREDWINLYAAKQLLQYEDCTVLFVGQYVLRKEYQKMQEIIQERLQQSRLYVLYA